VPLGHLEGEATGIALRVGGIAMIARRLFPILSRR
jgi:hypothetical protein